MDGAAHKKVVRTPEMSFLCEEAINVLDFVEEPE